MPFDPRLAEIRFGCGLSPRLTPPESAAGMMARLTGPDDAGLTYSIAPFSARLPQLAALQRARRDRRKAKSDAARRDAEEHYKDLRRTLRTDAARWTGHTFLRRALTRDGLRERLTAFWADHFTARGVGQIWSYAHLPYVEEAIRPHVAGRFADMLRAVIIQPLMLSYLDQYRSFGPDSPAAKGKRGLNENLARELLELHTLGADGPYTQTDVRQMAELLTGLTFDMKHGFVFRADMAEPGPETVLGISYGGPGATLDHIHAALDDLATHPATATHIARKLAVHFVSDAPTPSLIRALTARYTETGGDLAAVIEALLAHPDAWSPEMRNVKQPVDFVGSALRALDLVPRHLPLGNLRRMQNMLLTPMALMGQPMGAPPGPDGWPEDDADWITPQRLAARLQWAMSAPFQLRRTLPRPETFLIAALGPDAPEPVKFAARAAESRAEGIGIILASPAFQRF
ncbi:DUF1800 domain-containing protein [Pseudohalocynthiibacter aestuariivivens]|nr:DUF1800 domain-containing protein [Pseudohalocynthiibacter aestuariivivens]QIE47070.1 DUF1800 domain-containing protein [Pseudohalocynthiibacter aestuariivivens]